MKEAEHTARAVALTKEAVAKPPVVTELPMREIALDEAERAQRIMRAGYAVADLLHVMHPPLLADTPVDTCTDQSCVEARRLLEAAVDNPDPKE